MTFERIAGLFRRGREGKEPLAAESGEPRDDLSASANPTRPALPAPEVRAELTAALDHGFTQVAVALDRLNQHLKQNHELMASLQESQAQLPGLIQSQQKIAGLVANAERGNQAVAQNLGAYFKQRDEAQQALLRSLGQLATGAHDQRQMYQDQLKLVLRLQRGNRRVLLLLLAMIMLAALVLVVLVLVLALRPDLIERLGRGAAAPPTEQAAPPARHQAGPDV